MQEPAENLEAHGLTKSQDTEYQLIEVRETPIARSREILEGEKAKASDTHNWNNTVQL